VSQEKPKILPSPKSELEEKYNVLQTEVEVSEAYWNVFAEIVSGNNYTSSIGRKLRKNKSIVSRQLHKLHQLDVVVQMGSGVKQFYEINWVVFTTYWIWFADTFVDIVGDLGALVLTPERIPNWMSEFYLTPEEHKLLKSPLNIEGLLDQVIPQLSEMVRHIVETVSDETDVRTFVDAFQEVSIAIGTGLPDPKYINPKKIDIAHSRQLIETLYNPRVRAWLKLLALSNLASSNIVRNHILRLTGMIGTDEVAKLKPRI